MIAAFLVLIACELVGEVVREAFSLPIPGPVIGMFCLAAILALRKDGPDAPAIPDALGDSAETLIGHMGLLFIPAGVGIISEAELLRAEWLPILVGLIGSAIQASLTPATHEREADENGLLYISVSSTSRSSASVSRFCPSS